MSNDEQANSDPLPYTQVDRAVKPKATLLAAMIQSTTQHALGSLVEFWDLNGDPRELEKLVIAGKREVVLEADEVRRRFRLASGHNVDPDDLNSLGLLEKTASGYRVRGMSRYFAPVERRIQARLAASIGGKASAAARKSASGTAQPRSASGSETVREPLKRTPKRSRSGAEAAPEADTEAAPKREATQRSAVSGQRSAAGELLPRDKPAADPRHAPLAKELAATYVRVRKPPDGKYPWDGRDARAVTSLLTKGIAPTIVAAYARALVVDKYPVVRAIWELDANFAHYVGDTGPPAIRREEPATPRPEGRVELPR